MNKIKLEKYNKLKESLKKSDPLSSLKLKLDLNQDTLKKSDRLSSLKLKPELDQGSDHVSLRIPIGKEHLKLKI
jgi:hypothetical protein